MLVKRAVTAARRRRLTVNNSLSAAPVSGSGTVVDRSMFTIETDCFAATTHWDAAAVAAAGLTMGRCDVLDFPSILLTF